MDFREIVRDAAKRKLVDLAKSYLDIIDELKKEDAGKVDKFIEMAQENGLEDEFKPLRHFLYLIDDNKKDILRKRVLDEMNKLVRELEQ